MPFELFISYSRKDNVPQKPGDARGWVTALRDEILADHRRFSTEPLRIFLDTSHIKDMDDWRHRILTGLRESRILLVCLSPDYFKSEYCRWEFDEYVQRQVHALMGQDSFAQVYFVEVPGAPEHETAEGWYALLRRTNYTDLRPWFPQGLEALREAAVREKLAALGTSLWERIQRARRATGVPGNLRRLNPHFIGRRTELRQLHENLALGAIGVVTAVHGLGGQGKTELATAYAHGWADSYPGGLWVLGAEGKEQILPLLGELCAELALPLTTGPDETADARGRRVLAELRRRAEAVRDRDPDQGAACLVILDNVSEPALLAEPQLAHIPREDWLRVVVTTREGPEKFPASRQKSLAFIAVDALSEDDATRLIEDHQTEINGQWPAATAAADAAAARAMARELGGFTLAVESVAIYLGLHPDIRPADYLARLRAEGLTGVDALPRDATVAAQMQHREKQLRLVLDQSLARLAPAERTALDYAALLPPHSIPWPWLRAVVEQEHPDALAARPGYPDPWPALRRRLEGLRLLTPGDHIEIAHLHRMVAAHLRERMADRVHEALRVVRDKVEGFALALQHDVEHDPAAHVWQLAPMQDAVRHWREGEQDAALGHIAGVVGGIEAQIGRLDIAEQFLRIYHETTERNLAANPESAQAARDVSVSLNKLADFLASRGMPGDAEKALGHYQRSLEVSERLLLANPESAQAARDVSVSLERLGDFLASRGMPGDAEKALGHYQRSLEVRERLLLANPESAQAARDVSVSLERLGDFLARRGMPGDAEKALGHYQRSLEVRERLLLANPESAQAARDVSVSLNKLADFLASRGMPGDAEKALGHYQRSLEVRERLLLANPESAQAARDVSVSLNKLADFLASRGMPGDAEKALGHYQRSLEVSERLLLANPESAQAARDVSVSLNKLADFLASRGMPGDAEKALGHYQRSLEVSERLLLANPESAQAARDVSVSLERLGDFLASRGMPGDAEKALGHYQRSLEVRERLLLANPESAQAARDVSVSLERLGDFLASRGMPGDAEKALGHYQRSLEVRERLLLANPESAQAARDVSVSLNKLADFLASRGMPGDAEKALGHYQRSLEVSERLLLANPESAQAARDVSVSLNKLADFLASRGMPGDAEKALGHYQRSLEVSERLLLANPESAQAARDVSVSLNKLADFLASRGMPGDAEKALGHYQRSLEVRERLLLANPESAQAARDVLVSLERMAAFEGGRAGGETKALELQLRSLEIALKLREQNPATFSYQRTAAVSFIQTYHRAQAAGNQELSVQCLTGCFSVLNTLMQAGVELDPPMRQLHTQLAPMFSRE